MLISKDLLGKALLQCASGKTPEVFIERDDGFLARERIERYFYGYDKWPIVERKLIDSIEDPVLEIGCNIGMHLKFLKSKGLKVLGIDISPRAVKIARKNGVPCLLMDARKISAKKIKEKFNTVLILYYGLGLAGSLREQVKMFKAIAKITTEKAVLIGSSIDALRTTDPAHKSYQEFNRRKGKLYGDITQVTLRLRMKNEASNWYNLLFINPRGAKRIAEASGWKLAKALPETKEKQRWYFVFKKAC